jgi:hypothetical protein
MMAMHAPPSRSFAPGGLTDQTTPPAARRGRGALFLAGALGFLTLAGCQSAPSAPAGRPPAAKPPLVRGSGAPLPRLEIDDRQPPPPPAPAVGAAPTVTPPQPADLIIRTTTPPAAEPPAPPPTPPAPPADLRPQPQAPNPPPPAPGDRARALYQQAASKLAGVHDYVARFRRREVVNGKPQPEDLILAKFRKEPFSVYFKWVEGTACAGRELVYVKGQYNNLIQVRTGRGDFIAGLRKEIAPDSPMATANSRRTIDEAGLHPLIARLGQVLAAHESGAKTFGTLQYLGPQQRPESPVPMECLVQQVPPGVEKHLPKGGRRYWFFNADPQAPEHGLPTLIVTHDEAQREVEYYFFDRLNINVGLRPEEFDPQALWPRR